ncbi:MAG: hypothetical protein H7Y03_05390 [Chitinophagaceae bacterium]|nr:hypothetical protein [Chitinophagaceae bacterium]
MNRESINKPAVIPPDNLQDRGAEDGSSRPGGNLPPEHKGEPDGATVLIGSDDKGPEEAGVMPNKGEQDGGAGS